MSNRTANRDEQFRRLAETMRRQLGSRVCERMTDPNVVEVMLNADGVLWEDRLGCGMSRIGEMRPDAAETLIATVASTLRTTVTRENPIIECELPLDGSRLKAMIPPVVPGPVFTIRRKASQVFTFDDYVRADIMQPGQRLAWISHTSQRCRHLQDQWSAA